MAMIYLADTNIVSEIMRPEPHLKVQARWQQYQTQIAISAITWHELLTGVQRLPASKRRSAFEHFLFDTLVTRISVLAYDQVAATWHANERSRLMQQGSTPSFVDSQIAAIAFTNDLILVTRNTTDFVNFHDLSVENWFQ